MLLELFFAIAVTAPESRSTMAVISTADGDAAPSAVAKADRSARATACASTLGADIATPLAVADAVTTTVTTICTSVSFADISEGEADITTRAPDGEIAGEATTDGMPEALACVGAYEVEVEVEGVADGSGG